MLAVNPSLSYTTAGCAGPRGGSKNPGGHSPLGFSVLYRESSPALAKLWFMLNLVPAGFGATLVVHQMRPMSGEAFQARRLLQPSSFVSHSAGSPIQSIASVL